MDDSADFGASIVLAGALVVALAWSAVEAHLGGGRAPVAERVQREAALPVLGRFPMHAVYRAVLPLARMLVAARIHANAVTVSSLVLAAVAGVAFAHGRLGLGAAVALVAALADALDGIVARASGTSSALGKVLDTTIDRYVDAVLLGGLAVYVRGDVVLLVLVLAALVGSFMVSYASSVERELGQEAAGGAAPMRRAHRLAYLLTGAALSPFAARIAGPHRPAAAIVPVFAAVTAIAVVGNVSAVRRLFSAARRAPLARACPSSSRAQEVAPVAPLAAVSKEAGG